MSDRSMGAVYTPKAVVDLVLDSAGYSGPEVLEMRAMEPSCGDGAFLVRMAERFADEWLAQNGAPWGMARRASDLLHGIDMDKDALERCRERLDALMRSKGDFENVEWDLTCADTLEEAMSPRKYGMNIVVGNPPYVAFRNMTDRQKSVTRGYEFGREGSPDLYVLFFEAGLRMLVPGGRLAYVTPSSWLYTGAGAPLRRRVMERKECDSMVDLRGYEAGFDAQTSAMVTSMRKWFKHDHVMMLEWSLSGLEEKGSLTHGEMYMPDGTMTMITDKERRRTLKGILGTSPAKMEVRTGIKTGCDKAFIAPEGELDEGAYVRKAYKARKGETNLIVCPYGPDGRLVPFDRLPRKARDLLTRNRACLEARKGRYEAWYAWPSPSGE